MSVDAWLRVEVQSRAAGHPDDWDDWFGFGDDGDDDMTGGSTGGDVGGGGGGGGGGSHRHSPGDGSGGGELERGGGRPLCRPTLDELADTAVGGAPFCVHVFVAWPRVLCELASAEWKCRDFLLIMRSRLRRSYCVSGGDHATATSARRHS